MSHQLTVVFRRSATPTIEAINAELERLSLPCVLTKGESLESSVGSISATITSTGETRELQFEDSDWLNEEPELQEHAGERDRCIDFLLGSDMAECGLVNSIAAALSTIAEALVYYQPDELIYTAEDILAEAFSALEPPKRRR